MDDPQRAAKRFRPDSLDPGRLSRSTHPSVFLIFFLGPYGCPTDPGRGLTALARVLSEAGCTLES